MITEIIKKWGKNKHKLEEYYRNTKQEEYDTYEAIVRKIFEFVINTDNEYEINKMTIIDDGNYQGTQIFIIPENTYQPEVGNYIITHTYYGSCSGCDTLMGICDYSENEFPNEKQISGYMTLSLHLVQKMKYLYEE